mmetsp:Transcript_35722/g.82974  ORF Transcript_35722/g.82974 Transcript_35722/m.82974 type:complete len:288 (-) Transcript_35722:613-1476(-)
MHQERPVKLAEIRYGRKKGSKVMLPTLETGRGGGMPFRPAKRDGVTPHGSATPRAGQRGSTRYFGMEGATPSSRRGGITPASRHGGITPSRRVARPGSASRGATPTSQHGGTLLSLVQLLSRQGDARLVSHRPQPRQGNATPSSSHHSSTSSSRLAFSPPVTMRSPDPVGASVPVAEAFAGTPRDTTRKLERKGSDLAKRRHHAFTNLRLDLVVGSSYRPLSASSARRSSTPASAATPFETPFRRPRPPSAAPLRTHQGSRVIRVKPVQLPGVAGPMLWARPRWAVQ